MKKSLILFLFLILSVIVYGENNWHKSPYSTWQVDLDIAKKQAQEENKRILVLFLGSDWDAKSQKMMKEIFQNKKFRENLEEQFVILYIDSPIKKSLDKEQIRHNNSLRKQLKLGNKTPCTAVLDSKGNKITIIDGYANAMMYKEFFAKMKNDQDDEAKSSVASIADNIPAVDSSKWVKGPNKSWYVDFSLALAEAQKTGKKLYVLNTGSDWCGFCIRLREDVLDKGKFKKIAEQHLILVYLDSPRRKKLPNDQQIHNHQIARMLKFGGGVPSAIILSPDGKEIGRIGGYAKEKDYLKKLEAIINK